MSAYVLCKRKEIVMLAFSSISPKYRAGGRGGNLQEFFSKQVFNQEDMIPCVEDMS